MYITHFRKLPNTEAYPSGDIRGAVAVPTATSTTAVETTSSTAFKLPPVGDTPEEVEAEFVRFLREWLAEQPEATTIDGTTDQVLVDTGRELCEAVAKVEAATEGGHILGFYLFMGEELEAQGFNTDSFEAVVAVLLEALEDR